MLHYEWKSYHAAFFAICLCWHFFCFTAFPFQWANVILTVIWQTTANVVFGFPTTWVQCFVRIRKTTLCISKIIWVTNIFRSSWISSSKYGGFSSVKDFSVSSEISVVAFSISWYNAVSMFTVKREELLVNNCDVDSGSHVSLEVMGNLRSHHRGLQFLPVLCAFRIWYIYIHFRFSVSRNRVKNIKISIIFHFVSLWICLSCSILLKYSTSHIHFYLWR